MKKRTEVNGHWQKIDGKWQFVRVKKVIQKPRTYRLNIDSEENAYEDEGCKESGGRVDEDGNFHENDY